MDVPQRPARRHNIERMEDRIVTRVLAEAARIEGSTQALATRLKAPESTLQRWIDGHAQAPLRAFLAALDYVMEREGSNSAPAGAPEAGSRELVFRLGPLAARCARCDGEQFVARDAGSLRLTSMLLCRSCGEAVVHGNLLAQLAKDAVHHSRAATGRTRRAVEASRASVARGREKIARSSERVGTWTTPAQGAQPDETGSGEER